MSDDIVDIVQRLRLQAIVEAKMWGDAAELQIEWKAAAEIERLRDRVEVLESLMRGIAEYCDEGDRRTFIAVANTARAALKEAKP